jgi:hypothetical protein
LQIASRSSHAQAQRLINSVLAGVPPETDAGYTAAADFLDDYQLLAALLITFAEPSDLAPAPEWATANFAGWRSVHPRPAREPHRVYPNYGALRIPHFPLPREPVLFAALSVPVLSVLMAPSQQAAADRLTVMGHRLATHPSSGRLHVRRPVSHWLSGVLRVAVNAASATRDTSSCTPPSIHMPNAV